MSPAKLAERCARFMPAGVPRYIKCWDNGKSADRYTVVFTGRTGGIQWSQGQLTWPAIGMSAAPFHPQGVGQHCQAVPGKHLGRRIKFKDLPEDCQRLVLQDYKEIWRLNKPTASPQPR